MVICITCLFMWVVPFRDEGLFPNSCCHGDTEMDPALWKSHLLFFFFFFFGWISKKPFFPLALPSAPFFSNGVFSFEKKRRADDRKRKDNLETHLSLLHLLHLSTVGFNSAIILPLMLLALLMPTTMLLKAVNLCLPVAVATALFFLVLHPDRFLGLKALFALRLQQRASPPSCWTVFSTVWQNEQMCFFLRQIDYIMIFTRPGFSCNRICKMQSHV